MTNHFIVLLESIIKIQRKNFSIRNFNSRRTSKMLTACESMISGIERQTTLQELFEEQVAQQPDSGNCMRRHSNYL